MSTVESRLTSMGLILPDPLVLPSPNRTSAVQVGNMLYGVQLCNVARLSEPKRSEEDYDWGRKPRFGSHLLCYTMFLCFSSLSVNFYGIRESISISAGRLAKKPAGVCHLRHNLGLFCTCIVRIRNLIR